MSYNKLKSNLIYTVDIVNKLPSDFKVFNVENVKKILTQYMIFIEEFEQQRGKGNKEIKDIQEECANIQETLLIINKSISSN